MGHQKLHLWHANPAIGPRQEPALLFSPNKMAIAEVRAGEKVNLRLISTIADSEMPQTTAASLAKSMLAHTSSRLIFVGSNLASLPHDMHAATARHRARSGQARLNLPPLISSATRKLELLRTNMPRVTRFIVPFIVFIIIITTRTRLTAAARGARPIILHLLRALAPLFLLTIITIVIRDHLQNRQTGNTWHFTAR